MAIDRLLGREARPGTAILRGGPSGISVEALLGLASATEANMGGRESHHDLEGEEHDHDDFVSIVIDSGVVASVEDLRRRVSAVLALPGVLRVKGRVGVAGKAAPAVVQAVGPRLETWFAAGAQASGLVVIGLKDMDQLKIAALLKG